MKKMFLKVVELDERINEAYESGNEALENELYDEQCELMEKIENLGLREEFDKFIENM